MLVWPGRLLRPAGYGKNIVDPSFANVDLLVFFDQANGHTADFTDASPELNNVSFQSTAEISSAQKFGGPLYNSVHLEAETEFIFVNPPTGQFQIPASTPFCFETYARWEALGATDKAHVFQSLNNSLGNNRSWSFDWRNTATPQLRFLISTAGTSYDVVYTADFTPTINTNYHIACDRDALGNVRFWVNGAQVGSTIASSTAGSFNSTADMWMGQLGNFNLNGFLGFLAMMRITLGSSRYAAPFTIPSDYPRS